LNSQYQMSKEARIKIQHRNTEFSDWEEFIFDSIVDYGVNELRLSDLSIYEAKIDVIVDNNIVDQLQLRDGKWTIENPEDAYLFNVKKEERDMHEEAKYIEREAIAVARLCRDIDLTKELHPGGYNVDLSNFNTLNYYQIGIDTLMISFSNGEETLFYTILGPVEGVNSLTLDASLLETVSHVKFNLKSDELANPMRISDISFTMESLISDVQELATDELKLYPNPCSNILFTKFDDPLTDVLPFKIINHLGVLVLEGEMSSQMTRLNTSFLNSGHYVLIYQKNEGLLIKQFVVQH